MPFIEFPNVPPLPGVPNLRRAAIGALERTGLLTAVRGLDRFGLLDKWMGPQWGIFSEDGATVIQPDTITALECRVDEDIANHPVEKGGFASYNKVSKPFEVVVTMTCGGQKSMSRKAFLDALNGMRAGLDLYNISTPDAVYKSVCLVHYDYKRSSSGGISLVTVNCRFQEVRQTATTEYTDSTREPDGAPTQGGGTVTTSTANASEYAASDRKFIAGGSDYSASDHKFSGG